jgi:hypothetical protein
MSNKHKHHGSPNSTPATSPPTPAEAETPSVEVSPSTEPELTGEVVSGASAELAIVADDGMTLAHLAPKLPHLKRVLESQLQIQEGEIEAAIEELTPKSREAFDEMMSRLNPQKPGVHTSSENIRFNDLRVYHGPGSDPSRPKFAQPGSIYSTDGVLHTVPPSHKELFPNTSTKLVAAVIAYMEARTFWAPKDDKGNVLLPPGVELKGNVPICRSLDRKRGDRMGVCQECPYKPFKDGKYDPKACKDEVHLFLVLKGYAGIYRMVLSGTSVKTGSGQIRKQASNWKSPWQYFFEFDTTEHTKGTQRWFQIESRVATDLENPNGIPTSETDYRLLELLSRKFDNEMYYQGLVQIYTRSQNATSGEKTADGNELLAGATAAGTAGPRPTDYSQNNV